MLLKIKTELFQALRTNFIKEHVHKTQEVYFEMSEYKLLVELIGQ